MNTFLPYPDFKQSAQCLDNKRLGKQRVEAFQILCTLLGRSGGWASHPAVKMWKGHEAALALYGMEVCKEWIGKGFLDSCHEKISCLAKSARLDVVSPAFPFWLGECRFHSSHRSNLLRKFPEHYSRFGWTEANNLPYAWPV